MLDSVDMRYLVARYALAIKKAEASGIKEYISNKPVPGFKIIKVPKKPIKIAVILWNPNFSPRTGIANNDAIIGAVWNIAWFSDNKRNLIPKKNNTTQPTDEKALITWATGFFVFNLE